LTRIPLSIGVEDDADIARAANGECGAWTERLDACKLCATR